MTTAAAPPLFRSGDLGISSEWRAISYDWLPVLTKHGVAVYSYLRDTYEQQRNLRPLLMHPEGPTKRKMQHLLGLATDHALQGPEFLLATVGLVHVEVGYRPSHDPQRPNHTHVAYYSVGRLDGPALDWTMLKRVLAAVAGALDPAPSDRVAAARHRRSDAALRALGQAGFLQNCDPADLFYEYGAWPQLVPELVADEHWHQLFAALHGAAQVARYRRLAEAWALAARRSGERLARKNREISDLILRAQGQQRPGSAGSDDVTPARTVWSERALGEVPLPGTGVPEPIDLTPTGFVPALSQNGPRPVPLSRAGSGTRPETTAGMTLVPAPSPVPRESQADDQLMSCRETEHECLTTTDLPVAGTAAAHGVGDLPDVAAHLRDVELGTTRIDTEFWREVNVILSGTATPYPYTAGERKALQRQFQQRSMPVGVVLAALRAVMALPPAQRPDSLSVALKLDVFQACVEQALMRSAPAAQATPVDGDWSAFLASYRALGMDGGLRNVSASDYHVLHALFAHHGAACWEVLNRIEHAAACPARLSPRYLQRAILNNQREAALRGAAPQETAAAARRGAGSAPPGDERPAMLAAAGLDPQLLQLEWTPAYITAWIEAAERRRPALRNPLGWLQWGLRSGHFPADHPQLWPSTPAGARTTPQRRSMPASLPVSERPAQDHGDHEDLDVLWTATLATLAQSLPASEYATWIAETRLVDLKPDVAIVGTQHIFAREALEQQYLAALRAALQQQLGYPLDVHVVIAP